MSTLTIRPATIADAATIHHFIVELATYEKAAHEVLASVSDIESSLFGEHSSTQAVIASLNDEPVGFAVFFYNYSTWLGKHGLYLEDLYVSPEYRGIGAGKTLIRHLAKLAVEKGCGRFEWNVLDWNEPAIKFYQSIGAKALDEWVGYRLTGDALKEFAMG
ncbi:GCN5 family acetyltransferase [Shewanella mangrovi]|uniref:GCN5 family acetyltransferase n=1 Tax=Shewanella mangrovi TaxID=1515746 RepID=A0A094JFH8_9GAMM|nr:GCN5 family acetyltransferase [Shewanella mangrovi]